MITRRIHAVRDIVPNHAIRHSFFVILIQISKNHFAHGRNGRAPIRGKFSKVLLYGCRFALHGERAYREFDANQQAEKFRAFNYGLVSLTQGSELTHFYRPFRIFKLVSNWGIPPSLLQSARRPNLNFEVRKEPAHAGIVVKGSVWLTQKNPGEEIRVRAAVRLRHRRSNRSRRRPPRARLRGRRRTVGICASCSFSESSCSHTTD